MATPTLPDAILFEQMEQVFQGNSSNKSKSSGKIGDDYIAFDDDDTIEDVEMVEVKPKPKVGKSNDKRPSEPSKEKNSLQLKDKQESFNKKLPPLKQKIFFPKAPWMPRDVATAYGYLTGNRQNWLHFSERLHRELQDLSAYLAPTPAEATARSLLIKKCDAVVKKLFPGMRVECFGSVDTGLYLPTSDVDLVVVSDSSIDVMDPLIAPPLRKLARALIKASVAEPRSVQIISRARVPIIKFTDRLSGLPVDISFNVASGLEGARFLKSKLIEFPALKPLLRFLKLFLHLRGLNEVFRGGLGSFSAACLMLSFLQIHPLVQLGYLRPEDNLGILLMEFLELYGKHFNYERVGITVGIDTESSNVKSNNSAGTTKFFGYYDKEDLEFANESRPSLLSIQDPQCPSNDLARPSFAIASVRQAFEHAFGVLTAAAGELDAAREAKEPWQRGRTDGSILAGLIRLPQELIQQREFIERVFRH